MNPNEIRKLKEKAPFPLIILVVLMFLPSFLIQPERDLYVERIKEYDAQLKKARGEITRRSGYNLEQSRLNRLKTIRAGIDEQLPSIEMLPQVIDSIGKMAAEFSVELKDVTYANGDPENRVMVPCITLNMNVEALYENMRRFVCSLENLKYPLIVEEIVVSAGRSYRLTLKQLVK